MGLVTSAMNFVKEIGMMASAVARGARTLMGSGTFSAITSTPMSAEAGRGLAEMLAAVA